MTKSNIDPAILNAALQGLETKKQELEGHIAEVRRLLGTRGPATSADSGSGKRRFSAATRRKMAAAQKARWAKVRNTAADRKPAAKGIGRFVKKSAPILKGIAKKAAPKTRKKTVPASAPSTGGE